MENHEFDGMVMSTLDTFDISVSNDYDREELEMLDEIGDECRVSDVGQSSETFQAEHEDEFMLRNNTSWNLPAFDDASVWMNNMNAEEHVTNNNQFGGNELHKGMLFGSKEGVIHACQRYSIMNRVEYYTYKSDKTRIMLHCRVGEDNCVWHVRAVLKKKAYMWEITRYKGSHTCESDIIPADNAHFNKAFIAMEISDIIREKLRLTPRAIKQLMAKQYGYEIPYVKAWKARQKAFEYLFGDWKESFGQLPAFMNALQTYNPGSAVFWRTSMVDNGNMSVDRIFWAFAPAIEAFVHLRPILCIDGTHLYGKYKGVLLVAVGIDGNSHLVPIAYALVESENNDSWSWFMTCIRAGVTQRDRLCVISDRHVGILNAMKDPLWSPPQAYHRVCSRHLCSNFNVKVKSKTLKDYLARLAHLHQKPKFIKKFAELRVGVKDNISALRWLDELPLDKWALAYDEGGRRWGSMTTNASECFNNVLKGGRDLPIKALVQFTFSQANDYWTRRRDQYQDGTSAYVPVIERKLKALKLKATGHDVEMFDRSKGIGRVTTGHKRNVHIVDMSLGTCDCGKWEAFHYPCSHVLAVIMREHTRVSACVAPEYMMTAYNNTWNPKFNPIPDEAYWDPYEGPIHVPNLHFKRVKTGRQPTRRRRNEMDQGSQRSNVRRSSGEQAQGNVAGEGSSRGARVIKCSLCKSVGHNRKTCDTPTS